MPALAQLFVQAAARIHSRPGWLARAGTFPNASGGEFPLAKDAERYYRAGPPLLQRYLPFWLANFVDRMWVALFSIVAASVKFSDTAEAYGWVGTGQLIGAALGSAIAGFLIDAYAAVGAFWAASALAFHNWWHTALYHLDLGHTARALEMYDELIRPEPAKIQLQMVDAVALLWRLHLLQVDCGRRWDELADSLG